MFNTTEVLKAVQLGKELISTTFPINMKVVEYKLNNECLKALIVNNGEHYHTVTEFGQFLNDEPYPVETEEEARELYALLGTPLEDTPQGELHYSKGDYNYTISAARDTLTHDVDGVLCCIHHEIGLYRVTKRDGSTVETKFSEDFNFGDVYLDLIKRLQDLEGQA